MMQEAPSNPNVIETLAPYVIGAAIAYAGTIIKGYIDRRSFVSNKIYERRLEALSSLWISFSEAANAVTKSLISPKDVNSSKYRAKAEKNLLEFRHKVRLSRIILDEEIIKSFVRLEDLLESAMSNPGGFKEGKFMNEMADCMNKLDRAVNKRITSNKHKINLKLGRILNGI